MKIPVNFGPDGNRARNFVANVEALADDVFMEWIEVTSPAPILNTPKFRDVFSGSKLPVDENGHPFNFEFVALVGMRFKVLRNIDSQVLEIIWPEYDVKPLYIDIRFVKFNTSKPETKDQLPRASSILQNMETWIGAPYVWGGNWGKGIPEMLNLYPPDKKLDEQTEILWTFKGLDCSGLLFQATQGLTPRNTSQLIQFGESLPKTGLDSLLPMDMIIYPGHVLYVRDQDTIIESKATFGVRIASLSQRLKEIKESREFILDWNPNLDRNRYFTVRRFTS